MIAIPNQDAQTDSCASLRSRPKCRIPYFPKMCEFSGVKNTKTTLLYPQSDGMVETFADE